MYYVNYFLLERTDIVGEQILKEILGELKTLNKRVGSLEDGQKELISDVSGLKEGQQKIETRMKSMETSQQKIEARIGSLEDGQKELKSDVRKLENRMESLETGQRKIEARMESEIIEKIGALFNGYSLRGEQIENLQKHLDQRLDSIETDTGYLVSRVARLEKVVK